VVAGTAPDAYGDSDAYFAATHPSAGLRSLLDEVLGRLGGGRPDGAPVVRLETNLGGGKTHNLIALYHAARGHLEALRAVEFMNPDLVPGQPVAQIAVFVGTATGATSFPEVDGVTPHTLWGYLALQLGGVAAYEEVRSDDEHLTAPGANAVARIMGGRPTLVLIDEIARYLAVAEGRKVGTGTLANQTTAFLMALMEAVAAQPAAAVVLTTTQVTDAFGEQTAAVLAAFADAQSLIARKEHVLRPSDEADLPKILARRLFARIDSQAPAAVAQHYVTAAGEAFGRGADLPERMSGPGFATDVARSYPFHPDLITVLDKRLSTIPNFQRTRGALRLLARTIRVLWQEHPAGAELIHLHHIDLADKDIAEDLSSRLDKATFEVVIRADIASQPGGEPTHAEAVDARMGQPAASRLATTAYLWSLTRDVPGVPASTLIGGVLSPGDDPNVLSKALDNLEAAAWYLHCDARGYRFSVEPSLAKLVQEAESQISGGRVKQAATDILARQFRDSALKVRRSWEDAKVPDRDDDAWLVVLHWDEFGGDCGVSEAGAVPHQVRELWEKTPAGGVREYRNRLILLAPQARSHDAMLRTVRRHLALSDLARSGDTLRSLPEEKRKEVADSARTSELEARVAVCNHVNLLYVPQAGGAGAGGLEPVELDVATQANVARNQTDAVLDRLAAMEKTLAAGDKPLDPGWIAAKLGAQVAGRLPTIELVRA
nr:ATP-binding protein [Acidimicrobiia bacterium]